MEFVVRFRYIPPYEYMTPLMHIPIEETRVEAENSELAWESFCGGFPKEQQDWLKCEEIYQCTYW